MRWLLWLLVLPACVVALWLIVRLSLRRVIDLMRVEQAREQFRLHREWLEARFLNSIAKVDPIERLRWEEAHWHDEVLWARDRQTRRLLALIGVHFDSDPFDSDPEHHPRHATVVFEFCRGRWRADGKRLDEMRPDEAFLRHRRYEPVSLPPRRV
jgi:hypothetical protein